MTINELLNSMTTEFRESLWDIFIDNDEVETIDDPEFLESEVDHWYIEPPYTEGHFFVMKMCIYTRQYVIEEIEKRNREEHEKRVV